MKLNSTDNSLIVEQGNRARFFYEVTYSYLVFLKEGKPKALGLTGVLENDSSVIRMGERLGHI